MDIPNLQQFTERMSGIGLDDYVKKVKKVMQQIFELLHKSKVPLDRCRLVGGLEKKTSTPIKADADVVVFFNDVGKSKESILQDFQDILLLNTNLKERQIKIKHHSMKFVMNGIPFDLLIAKNNVPPNSNDVIGDQRKMSMLEIEKASNYTLHKKMEALTLSAYCKSLLEDLGVQVTESSVEFIKKQGKIAHDLAKLAKYWNQQMLFKKYVYGRSTIMELLAIKAGQEEENNNPHPSLGNALKRFLEKVCFIEQCNIYFLEYYNLNDIPADMLLQKPLLLDPSNQFNNLLESKQGKFKVKPNTNLNEFMSFISNAAGICLQMIGNGCRDVNMIFYPQPLLYQLKKREEWIVIKQGSYLVSIDKIDELGPMEKHNMMVDCMPGYVIRDPKGDKFMYDIEAILFAYSGYIYNLMGTKKYLSDTEIKDGMESFINKMNDRECTWIPSSESHATKAVSMFIPIEVYSNLTRGLCISLDFHVASR